MTKPLSHPGKLVLSLLALTATGTALLTPATFLKAQTNKKTQRADTPKPATPKAARPLTEDEKIVHVLNRLGFGPRPGDVARVKAMGLKYYIAEQLQPERIDDSAVDRQLASFTEIHKSGEELADLYRGFTQNMQQALALRKQQQQAAAKTDAADTTATEPAKKARLGGAGDAQAMQEMRQQQREMLTTALPLARAHKEFMAAKVLRAVDSNRQLQEVMADFWSNHFNIDLRKPPCSVLKIMDEREVIRPHLFGKFRDLLGASAKSPAMLVYLDNFQSSADMPTIPPALARRAAARRKAADAANTAPDTAAPAPPKPQRGRPMGLNENYARELMELHTLGVDGGYTQQDVREVARCLTGWSVGDANARRPQQGRYMAASSFRFFPARHDDGEKRVLGQVLPAGGGQQDGEKVLDMLASHPSTMRHISRKLCQRLVSDEPPTSLIEKCVSTWKKTDGDLREIVRTIVTSPEFYAPSVTRSKIKSPFVYAVSSIRALGGTYNSAMFAGTRPKPADARSLVRPPKGGGYLDIDTVSLVGQIGTMGQPLFQFQAPTGYPEDSRKWVSSGALISRLNYALALTEGKLTDIDLQDMAGETRMSSDANQRINQMAQQILQGNVTPATRATLLKEAGMVSDDASAPSRIAALLLGSPEFQRH